MKKRPLACLSQFSPLMEEAKTSLIPLRKREPLNEHTPVIVNMVSTVSILPPGYTLPLSAIAAALGPGVQYAPAQFAAAIIPMRMITGDITVLAFPTGNLVIVSTLTHNHTLHAAQLMRTIIERIPCAMWDPNGERVVMTSLEGRTIYGKAATHNIVGHGDLGRQLDLAALRDANPTSVKWHGDNFPAAKCCVWLTKDCACHCESKPLVSANGKRKCSCVIKCLCFSSGKIVLMGARRIDDINSVFFRMKALSVAYEGINQFVTQFSVLIVNPAPAPRGVGEPQPMELEYEDEDWAMAYFLSQPLQFNWKRTKLRPLAPGTTPLLRFAEQGRLREVEFTLTHEPHLWSETPAIVKHLHSLEATPGVLSVLDFLKKGPQGE